MLQQHDRDGAAVAAQRGGASAAAVHALGLTNEQWHLLRETVLRHLPQAQVFVVGSRAEGRARPFSDIDLLIERPASLDWSVRAALADAFEASALPMRVDLVPAAEVRPPVLARMRTTAVPLFGAGE